ncbi:MAG: hypothetical protein M3P53_02085 [Actinomycetota bacterium]|nr:hypothetical protein [Actinomycetota bacterium]
MDDYEFTHDVTIPGGRVVFRFRNTGSVDQEAVLVALPTDLAPLRQQLASDERLAVETIAVLPARPPGRRGMFAVDLAAGRYELVCFVMDADGVDHSTKGMGLEFRVG